MPRLVPVAVTDGMKLRRRAEDGPPPVVQEAWLNAGGAESVEDLQREMRNLGWTARMPPWRALSCAVVPPWPPRS